MKEGNIELAKIEIERDLILCNKCLVSTMCAESCENFHNEVMDLLPPKKYLDNFKKDLADDIRKAVVNTSFQTITVTFKWRLDRKGKL